MKVQGKLVVAVSLVILGFLLTQGMVLYFLQRGVSFYRLELKTMETLTSVYRFERILYGIEGSGAGRTGRPRNQDDPVLIESLEELRPTLLELEAAFSDLGVSEEFRETLKELETHHESLTEGDKISSSVKSIEEVLSGLQRELSLFTEKKISLFRIIALLLFLTVILGSLLYVVLYSRRFSRRISRIEGAMKRVAHKDLTVTLEKKGDDEISTLEEHLNTVLIILNDFFITLREAVEKVSRMRNNLTDSTEESVAAIEEISQNISSIKEQLIALDGQINQSAEAMETINSEVESIHENIGEQTHELKQTSSAVEEMATSIGSVAKIAVERKKDSESLLKKLKSGGIKIESANKAITSISAELDEVQKIIEIINNVSAQTNLLSMNAAIESAHAGEAGRGFAVVAEEIRKLADSTSENAKVIGQAINSITGRIKEAAEFSDQSRSTFVSLEEAISTFVDTMVEISGTMDMLYEGSTDMLRVNRVTIDMSTGIKDRTERTKESVREIHKAISSIRSISSEIVEGTGEINQGIQDMSGSMNRAKEISTENNERMRELETTLNTFNGVEET
jgi:methyl-accepting chemotaxis protein